MRIGLRDVAARAGVSESTVSRVVNDRPGVRRSTRELVRRVIDELGYERSGLNLNLRPGIVGLIVPELENPIFPILAQAIETGFANRGFTSVLCTATADGVQEPGYLDMLAERGVSGITVVSGLNANSEVDHEIYADLLARGMPMVFVNGAVDGLATTTLSTDTCHAARVAVRHLVALGHERIGAIVGPRRYVPTQRRIVGYREAVTEAFGSVDDDLVVSTIFSVEGGQAAAANLLDAGCTGLVCGGDLMALGAIRAVSDAGQCVPRDVSVVGYDDSLLMGFVDPPLTTVRQPVEALSAAVVRMLLAAIEGESTEQREYLFRPELIDRESTGPVGRSRG